ncbi:MAG: NTP pyrophosphohydrolase [Proteobacteria bacterium]|nr:MAG: NTP pyrophosphohydrolase [Pseudomonadota bacterium]
MPNTAPEQHVIALVAVFNSNHELLLLKRPDDVHCGGLWSLPGGKIENNEMPLQAALRELKEETNLSGKIWRHLGKSSHSYADRTLHFLLFVCYCPDISNIHAESEYIWLKRDTLDPYPMPEANKKLIDMLFMDEVDNYLNTL